MALSSALMNKGDYKYREANLTLRQMAIADEIQRKEEIIKDIENDFSRCESATKKWDEAFKNDQNATKQGEAQKTDNRAKVKQSSDWQFAITVGVKVEEAKRSVIKNYAASDNKEFGETYWAPMKQQYLAQLQSEQTQLELEQDSIDTQLESVKGMIKGLDGLVSNAAQDNAFWAVGG